MVSLTPSQQAKAYGVRPTLVSAARRLDISVDTLRRWHKTKPLLFEAVCRYVASKGVSKQHGTKSYYYPPGSDVGIEIPDKAAIAKIASQATTEGQTDD